MKIYICEVFQRCMFLHSVGLDLNMRFDDKKKSISCDKSVKKLKKKEHCIIHNVWPLTEYDILLEMVTADLN